MPEAHRRHAPLTSVTVGFRTLVQLGVLLVLFFVVLCACQCDVLRFQSLIPQYDFRASLCILQSVVRLPTS